MEAVELKNYSYEDYLEIDSTTSSDTMVELIFGEIYMMSGCSIKHQNTVGNLYFNIRKNKKTKCKVVIAPFDIKINIKNNISVAQPDVMIFCKDKIIPCAVFEVLSKSTAYKDKGVKKELYETAGIKEYFIINTELKIIDKYILKKNGYFYVRGFNIKDEIKIDCVDVILNVSDIFDDIE